MDSGAGFFPMFNRNKKSLAPITLPDGREIKTVLLPLTLGGERPGVPLSPPKLGEHNAELLAELGYNPAEVVALSPERDKA